jgi:Protein of unknown function (DUF1569)
MKSLFDAAVSAEITERINRLSASSQPLWGKMQVAQMLAHCQTPIRVGLGDQELKRNLIGILFGRIAKRIFLSEKPFKQGLPTDKAFIYKDDRDFEKEKAGLIALVERFQRGGAAGISRKPHPFFGVMAPEEWAVGTWKHLDHHLRQFGV